MCHWTIRLLNVGAFEASQQLQIDVCNIVQCVYMRNFSPPRVEFFPFPNAAVRESEQQGELFVLQDPLFFLFRFFARESVYSVNIHCHVPMPLSEGRTCEKINIMLLR